MTDAAGGLTCRSCGASMDAGEKFCAACGVATDAPATEPSVPAASIYASSDLSDERARKLATARKWLMAISILTLISGFIFYGLGSSEVEKQIRDAEAQIAGMDPVVRDQMMKQQTGMTWDEAVAHDRGQVTMFLVINIGLAIVYLGMWFWAKKNALAATIVALLLFITTILINAVMEPETLAQGVIVKVLFIVALAKAVSAAQEERKLAGRLAARPAVG